MIARPQFVVFDYDGVLVDSERIWFSVAADELRKLGIEQDLDRLLAKHRGKVVSSLKAAVEMEYGTELPDAWVRNVVTRGSKQAAEKLRPVSGSIEAVESVAAAGLPLAVASGSCREAIARGLRRLGIAGHVKGRIASSQEDGKHKPLPGVYFRACALIGMPPDLGVAVEDTPVGIESASAAGLTVVGYAADGDGDQLVRAGAKEVLTRMSELSQLLRLHV